MQIYLSIDLEGINGVVHSSQTQPGEPGYERAVALMHNETNAVIDGVMAAGASSVLVNDSHYDMRNLKIELLNPHAQLISGWQKPYSMVSGIDQGFDAACFVGYHSKAGTAKGVLCHTYRAKVFSDFVLNGKSVGEIGLNAALAGWFNVPIALVTGDDATCAEAKDLLGNIATVTVKQAVSRYAAVCPPEKQVLDKLRSTAADTVKKKSNWCLFKPPSPSTLEIVMIDPSMADGAELLPFVKRTGANSISITHEDYSVIFKMMLGIGAIGASRRDPHF